eukprot:GILI01010237.1.p1 GENE.GILI01010237.1~~GILI01010237.1.p1  ORF type:complete len:121 (+),score=28.60 GILI01010237.1:77-439(+)
MLRRFTAVSSKSASALSVVAPRRAICDCGLVAAATGVAAHYVGLVQPSSYALAALPYSAVATTAYIALAYNTCIGALVYAWLYLEMVTRDYVQDLVYATLLRYMFYIALLLTAENLFVEA